MGADICILHIATNETQPRLKFNEYQSSVLVAPVAEPIACYRYKQTAMRLPVVIL